MHGGFRIVGGVGHRGAPGRGQGLGVTRPASTGALLLADLPDRDLRAPGLVVGAPPAYPRDAYPDDVFDQETARNEVTDLPRSAHTPSPLSSARGARPCRQHARGNAPRLGYGQSRVGPLADPLSATDAGTGGRSMRRGGSTEPRPLRTAITRCPSRSSLTTRAHVPVAGSDLRTCSLRRRPRSRASPSRCSACSARAAGARRSPQCSGALVTASARSPT